MVSPVTWSDADFNKGFGTTSQFKVMASKIRVGTDSPPKIWAALRSSDKLPRWDACPGSACVTKTSELFSQLASSMVQHLLIIKLSSNRFLLLQSEIRM